MSLDDYKDWLETQKYTESTIDASLKVLRRIDQKNPKPTKVDEFLLRRYLRYVKETRRNPLGKEFSDKLVSLGLSPAIPRSVSGTRKRKLLSLEKYHALKERCERSTDLAAAMVAFYLASGLKPKDFLLKKIKDVTFVKDHHFFDQYKNRTFLYEILSPSMTWAYRMMLAAVKKEARALDIDADLGTLYRSRLELL